MTKYFILLISLFVFSFILTVLLEGATKGINWLLCRVSQFFSSYFSLKATSMFVTSSNFKLAKSISLLVLAAPAMYFFPRVNEHSSFITLLILFLFFFTLSFKKLVDLGFTQFDTKAAFILMSALWLIIISIISFIFTIGINLLFYYSSPKQENIPVLLVFTLIAFLIPLSYLLKAKKSWFFKMSLFDDFDFRGINYGVDDIPVIRYLERKVLRSLDRGLLRTIIWFTLYNAFAQFSKKLTKNYYKIKGRYYLRRKAFGKLLATTDVFFKPPNNYSETLIGLKALSLLYLGELSEARKTLEKAIGANQQSPNPHLWLYLGYLYWHLDEPEEAIEKTNMAIQTSSEAGYNCPIAYRNKAFYMAEQAMLKYRTDSNKTLFENSLLEAERNLENCMNSITNSDYEDPDLTFILHTKGFIALLRGNSKIALPCFLKSMSKWFWLGPRFHLAMSLMIGDISLERAKYHFKLLCNLNYHHKFRTLAEQKLKMIELVQKHGNILFNKKILLYQFTHDGSEIPEDAIAQPEDWAEIESFRREFYNPTFQIYTQYFNPFSFSKRLLSPPN